MTNLTHCNKDADLKKSLEALGSCGPDYWSFKGNSHRDFSHGFFQYPAMMVPQMVRVVLEKICEVHPEIKIVNDPFVGSGTILTEAILRGLDFTGRDINPLAILLCQTKMGPFFPGALKGKVETLVSGFESDHDRTIEVHFPNQDKWFSKEAQVDLSRIFRGIKSETSLWARRFFWVAMAETSRLVSNTRTSTFKLHIREEENQKGKSGETFSVFKKAINRNLDLLIAFSDLLKKKDLISRGRYKGNLNINFGDSRVDGKREFFDLIITSPPYGDNVTTVPYGQFSYLPLQWIDLRDIGRGVSTTCLNTTHEIDTRSLGGIRRLSEETFQALSNDSPTLKEILTSLTSEKRDRKNRVAAFFRDLRESLGPISNSLKSGGIMVWTLGNRRVGGIQIPLDKILRELLKNFGVTEIAALTRQIHSKRMALKNNIAELMNSETILVFRKRQPNGE